MVPATRNTVERPVPKSLPYVTASRGSILAIGGRARTGSETIGGITHQSPETVSPQHGFAALAGQASHLSSTRSIFEKISVNATVGPRTLPGLMGQRKDG